MQYDIWRGEGRGGESHLPEVRTRRRTCRVGPGEVAGCSAGTPPEVGVLAPGERPQGWADRRLTVGYLERREKYYSVKSPSCPWYSLSRLMVVAGWKAGWEWNTSEVQEDGEDSGVGMVKLRESEVESEVEAECVSPLSYRGGLPQVY